VLDFKIACRVIDCFLIDGEVFIYRTGIALLIYFESTLIKSSHYQIKDWLKNFFEIDAEKLFRIIMDEVIIDEDKIKAELAKQLWSNDKKKVLSLLLLSQ